MIDHCESSPRLPGCRGATVLIIAAGVLLRAAATPAAVVPDCTAFKLKKEGIAAAAVLKCHATAAKKQRAVDAACIDKAQRNLDDAFTKADEKGPCSGGQGFEWSLVDEVGTGLVGLLRPPSLNAASHFVCAAAKLKLASKLVAKKLKCHAKATKKGAAVDPACLAKVDGDFAGGFQDADAAGGCGTTGDAAAALALANQFSTGAVELLTAGQLPIRCCAAEAAVPLPTPLPPFHVNGCADLVIGTCTQAASLLAGADGSATTGAPGTVCNGATGSCQAVRTGTSTCCEASKDGLQICAEGPALAGACALANGTAGITFSEHAGEVCVDHYPGLATCD